MKRKTRVLLLLIPILAVIVISSALLIHYGNKHQASQSAKEYVEANYGFTVTEADVRFSIDGLKYASVSTKETPFKFDVFINSNYEADGDMYLNALTEYTIEENVRKAIPVSEENYGISANLYNRLTNKYNGITAEEITQNPEKMFELSLDYSINIYNIAPDSENCYLIFKGITESFKPSCITFVFAENKKSRIYEKDYASIRNPDDIKIYIY